MVLVTLIFRDIINDMKYKKRKKKLLMYRALYPDI